MSGEKKVNRREYIKYIGAGVAGLAIGGAIGYLLAPGKVEKITETITKTETTTAAAATVTQTVTKTVTATTPKKIYTGISLRVPQMAGWLSQAPGIALVSEFEKETGIKIVYDMIPPADVASKQWLEVSNRTGNYDIVTVGVDRVHPRFLPYCIGINKYIEEYWGSIKDFEDKVFLEPQKTAFYEGEYRGIPIHLNSPFGVYRKQLFENPENQKKFESEYGYELRPPKTIQELEDIATFFTKPPMYGLTANLGGAPVPAGFVTFLDRFMSAGFDVLDKDFRPLFKYNDKAYELGVEIARWFQDGIYKKKFINPDAATFRAGTMADFIFQD
ncbi:MAG: extracellular solute-binding protein [Candidatus Micrarchaeia archaeon]